MKHISEFGQFMTAIMAAALLWICPEAQEVHPVLLVRREEFPSLREKMGSADIWGPTGAALRLALLSDAVPAGEPNPHAEAIRALLAGMADEAFAYTYGVDADFGIFKDAKYDAMIMYDLLYEYIPEADRSRWRDIIWADADYWYAESVKEEPLWWLAERYVSNWTVRHGGFSLQHILYPALMFPDDPRSPQYQAKGLELLRWLMEAAPNDGEWDPQNHSWVTPPAHGDMIDETLGTPNSYGLWLAHNLAELMQIVQRNTGFNPYEYLGRLMHSEARYWTYLLTFAEGLPANQFNIYSLASYGGQTGHGELRLNEGLGVYSNSYLFHWARIYNDPVLAWHYYANPAPLRNRSQNHLGDWQQTPDFFYNILALQDWGEAAPMDPVSAGWPLTEFWPNAGVGVIRKRWEKKGPGSGLIWLRAGMGGGHDRPTQCGLQYHADGAVIFGGVRSDYNYDFLSFDPHTNNTMFIDGMGQKGNYAGSGELERSWHGHTRRIGADAFLMSTAPRDPVRTDYQDYYRSLPFGVNWTRKVHFDREADILWFMDRAATDDGAEHEYMFNFVTDAVVIDDSTAALPAGYFLAASSRLPLASEVYTANEIIRQTTDDGDPLTPDYPGEVLPAEYGFNVLNTGVTGRAPKVLWAVGRDSAALRAYLAAHRGILIRDLRVTRTAQGVQVAWNTDEAPVSFRIDYGPGSASRQSITGSGGSDTSFSVPLSESASGDFTGRLTLTDAQGDESFVPFGTAGILSVRNPGQGDFTFSIRGTGREFRIGHPVTHVEIFSVGGKSIGAFDIRTHRYEWNPAQALPGIILIRLSGRGRSTVVRHLFL